MVTEQLEECLASLVPKRKGPVDDLLHAVRYALLGGGKRLRPRLCIALCQQLGEAADVSIMPACALEMVHAYSLIHDDLPCMDDSDLRRGRPSVHKAFGEAQGVLAGDLLLTRSFEVIAECDALSALQRLRLTQVLARRAGCDGMIGGQAMDLAFEGSAIAVDALRSMHLMKTGALIAAACEFAGIIAQVDERVTKSLALLGLEIGLAFQIVDDLLDATGEMTQLGKPVGADAGRQKATYVSMLGMEASRSALSDVKLQAISRLQELPGSSEESSQLIRELLERRS